MAKDLPYFKFFCSEWNDGDITLEDYSAQGLFINICSYYWSNECEVELTKLKKKFKQEKKTIDYLIKEGLIKVNNGLIVINFLDEQLAERKQKSRINSMNGAKGGRPRKTEKKPNGFNSLTQTKGNKKRKEKIREDISDLGGIIVKPEPTKQIIQQYFLEHGMVDSFTVDETEKFYHYYKNKEWIIGGKPMNVEQACKAWVDNKPSYMYNPEQDKRNQR